MVMNQSIASGSQKDKENAYESVDEHEFLTETSISSRTELGEAESSIKVPKQRAYRDKWPVLLSSLANTSCASLTICGLLDYLNTTLRTSYTLEKPFISSLLEDCIANFPDFGAVYGRLRTVWFTDNWHTITGQLSTREWEDREMRQRALVGNQIVTTKIPARRFWDLYSNRVLPSWVTYRSPVPISHAWMNEKDRVDVWTPINGYEWPVPIPKDTNLDLIRIEMLNMGAEYAWLDVLCLRQRGGQREDLRAEEWTLDVPTIGNVYHDNTVVCYLNGLGRPLTLTAGDLESDRCWFRRAWTLQEIGVKRIIAGDTPDGPLHTEMIEEECSHREEILRKFHAQLRSLEDISMHSFAIFDVLANMQHRVSTNPVDKIAGMAFLLRSHPIPAYSENQSLENAWTALVNTMHARFRADLFFVYPEPGNGCKTWRPSWEQIMMKSLPADAYVDARVYRGEADMDWFYGIRIENGFVLGLAAGSTEGVHRYGELVVEDTDGGMTHIFKITVTHPHSIPEDRYTLLGTHALVRGVGECWVIGRMTPEHSRFKKVSVLRITDYQEREKLKNLGIANERVKSYLF